MIEKISKKFKKALIGTVAGTSIFLNPLHQAEAAQVKYEENILEDNTNFKKEIFRKGEEQMFKNYEELIDKAKELDLLICEYDKKKTNISAEDFNKIMNRIVNLKKTILNQTEILKHSLIYFKNKENNAFASLDSQVNKENIEKIEKYLEIIGIYLNELDEYFKKNEVIFIEPPTFSADGYMIF